VRLTNAFRALGFLAVLSIVAAAPASYAQPVDPQKLAAAQALYDQGLAALANKDYGDACTKLEDVTRILPNGVGGLLTLAHCYEGAGRLASAWTTYVLAQSVASRSARSADEAEGRTRAEALKPQLADLVIVVSPATGSLPGLSITRDGVPVDAAQWHTPVPVDKGKHTVAATAAGAERWEIIIDVPSDGASVSITIPDLVVRKSVSHEPPLAGATAAPRPVRSFSQRTAGSVLMGVGGVGLLVGVVAGALVIAQHGSLAVACPRGQCPSGEQADVDTYHVKSLASDVGFASGALLLTTGLVLVLTSPNPGRAQATPLTGHLGLGAVSVEGRF
jgi:hypothetical protein